MFELANWQKAQGDLGEKAFEFRGCRVRCAQVLFVAVTGQTRGAPRGPWWLGLRPFSGKSVRNTQLAVRFGPKTLLNFVVQSGPLDVNVLEKSGNVAAAIN